MAAVARSQRRGPPKGLLGPSDSLFQDWIQDYRRRGRSQPRINWPTTPTTTPTKAIANPRRSTGGGPVDTPVDPIAEMRPEKNIAIPARAITAPTVMTRPENARSEPRP